MIREPGLPTTCWKIWRQLEYHKAEISQLEELYDITGENVFNVYADRFEKYLKLMPLEEQ